ncbi:MAG: TrbC/VirB2 family protein [Pseudodesulfovibrio sp.]|jgi:type IV secretion system protein VirB2|nr:TrbC/VirB2 family protein [Pseudodesulfovibrio sp.]
MNKGRIILFSFIILAFLVEPALASNAISEFNSPFESVVGTITGPIGRWISIAAMALCGIMFIMKREELTGGFKLLLGVVFGICFIAFAASIVDSMFTFSGALI